jgi:hypothetical protein
MLHHCIAVDKQIAKSDDVTNIWYALRQAGVQFRDLS